jgi:hypothetical protein
MLSYEGQPKEGFLMDHPILKQLPGLKKEIRELFIAIKKDTDWKQLRKDFEECSDDETPNVTVTIGCSFDFDNNEISWNYQTGDNSYVGGAYGHPEWFLTYIFSRSNCTELAKDIIDEIEGRIYEIISERKQ